MKIFIYIIAATLVIVGTAVWYFSFHQEGYSGSLALTNQKLVVFDFDGTLCDSLQEVVNEFNAIDQTWALTPITDLNEIRNSSIQHVLEAHGVNKWKLPIIKYKLVKAIAPHIANMKPPLGIPKTLAELKKRGYKLGILTSNSHENTMQFLKNHDMNDFDFVYYGSSLFGKARLLKEIQSKTKAAVIFYVGDEGRDIDAAKKVGVPSIAVTWGYQSNMLLSKHSPTYIIQSPQELIKILK